MGAVEVPGPPQRAQIAGVPPGERGFESGTSAWTVTPGRLPSHKGPGLGGGSLVAPAAEVPGGLAARTVLSWVLQLGSEVLGVLTAPTMSPVNLV